MVSLKDIKILYEDNDILVIDKPAGVMVHEDGKNNPENVILTDWILENYPKIDGIGQNIEKDNGEIIKRPGIVHRLDKDTSGVLIICKNQDSFEFIKKQFHDREVEKTYNAFCYGSMKYDEGKIEKEIGRSKNFGKWTAIPKSLRGQTRNAETEYKVISKNDKFSFLELKIKTGRTHQIRVHMQFLNYPIVADNIYAGKRYDISNPVNNLMFKRLALHAKKIKFIKTDGSQLEIESDLPKDFQFAVTKLVSI